MGSCNCNCGTEVKGRFKRGHSSRLKYQRDAITAGLRNASTKGRLKRGKGVSWNVGLTKITDERVERSARKLSKTNSTEENRRALSKRMSHMRRSGVVVSPSGPKNGMWKGGTTTVKQLIVGCRRLYELWKKPILVRDGFKCVKCKTGGNLAIHHDVEKMSDILDMFMVEMFPHILLRTELTHDEKRKVVDAVVNYHIEKNVHGVTLCRSCHDSLHDVEGR
jgi:hypothetical protein